MATKKTPMRMCVGCREMKPKMQLLRVVRTPSGEVKLDTTGRLNGRGAYICHDAECLKRAAKANSLSRAFEMSVSQDMYDCLQKELEGIEK